MGAVWAGNRGGKGSTSKGSMVSRLGASAYSRLCVPHSGLLAEREPPTWWRGLPTSLHSTLRLKGTASHSDQRQQQMRRPTAFLSTSVDLCLESLVPEAARHMP